MMKALGFIETVGLLPAVEAADAMLKAAEVRLVDKSLASGGLVTITVSGEVAAVKASVDAGAAAVERIQGAKLVSRHVIARPDDELEKIITAKKTVKNENAPAKTEPAPQKTGESVPPAAASAGQKNKKNTSTKKKR